MSEIDLKGAIMGKIETVQDYKNFLKENKDNVLEKAVKIENLPPDDEWANDISWDEIFAENDDIVVFAKSKCF